MNKVNKGFVRALQDAPLFETHMNIYQISELSAKDIFKVFSMKRYLTRWNY